MSKKKPLHIKQLHYEFNPEKNEYHKQKLKDLLVLMLYEAYKKKYG